MLPPLPFRDILRDRCYGSFNLRNEAKVFALRNPLQQTKNTICELERILPHFKLFKRKNIPLAQNRAPLVLNFRPQTSTL